MPCYMLSYTRLLSFSIFVTIFPSEPTLASTRTCLLWILLKLRIMEVVVIAGANRCAKLQSNDHHQQTNTQLFTVRMSFMSPNQQCQSTTTTYSYLNDDKLNSCDICSARITTNKNIHSACKSVDV